MVMLLALGQGWVMTYNSIHRFEYMPRIRVRMLCMMNARNHRSYRFSVNIVNCVLAAAVGSAGLMAGCQSALDKEAADRGSARYTESLLARSILQNTYHGEGIQDPTISQGVRELPRVDAAGPATTTDSAVVPDNVAATAAATMSATTMGAATGPAVAAATEPTSAPAVIPAATAPTTDAATASTLSPPPATTPTTDMASTTAPASMPAATSTSQPTPAGNAPLPAKPLTSNELGNTSAEANEAGLTAATLNAPEPLFNLSLQDAIARTLKNALDIRAQAYDPAIKESLDIQQDALFDPVIFGSAQYNNTDEPRIQTTFNPNLFTNTVTQLGVKKLLPSGGTAQVSTGVTYFEANPRVSGAAFAHYWEPNVNATLTQPLLRGFGTAVTQANLYLAQRDHRISLATFRRQVITSVANVEEAYLNLVLARTSVAIQEQLLLATEDTYKRVHDRILVDADQISVNQSIAAVEQRRAELINDRIQLRAASDKLKSLMNDPEINVNDNALVFPTDKPIAEPVVFSTAEAIETALHQRTELQEDRLKLERADIIVSVAKNDLLPKLDLTASVQSTGLNKELDAAFSSVVSQGHFIDYAAGVRLEIPIGNRGAEAAVRQRQLERNQLLTQTVLDAQNIVLDVKTQLRELLGRYQELQSRERSRISAAAELKAITDKEKIVALTPEFLQLKLDAQASLAQSEQTLIQSMTNYNLALMRLERAKGTLLEFDRISLDRAPIYRPEDDNGKIRFMGKTFSLVK